MPNKEGDPPRNLTLLEKILADTLILLADCSAVYLSNNCPNAEKIYRKLDATLRSLIYFFKDESATLSDVVQGEIYEQILSLRANLEPLKQSKYLDMSLWSLANRQVEKILSLIPALDAARLIDSQKGLRELEKQFRHELHEVKKQYNSTQIMLDEAHLEQQNFKQETEKILSQASDFLRSLADYKNNAQELLEIVGDASSSSHYRLIANHQEKSANFWRGCTLGFFGLSVLLASYTFYYAFGTPHLAMDVQGALAVLLRLLFALVIASPAWYCAAESARHRSLADRARQTEMELASLGPFLEKLPETAQTEIRSQLSKKYFGQTPELHRVEDSHLIHQIKDLIIEALKAAKK
jgi:hypothetical protein